MARKKIETQILCRLCNEWFPESQAGEDRGKCPRCASGARLDRNRDALQLRRDLAELKRMGDSYGAE